MVQYIMLWFYDPQVVGLNPVVDSLGYELSGEIDLKDFRFFAYTIQL